MKQHVLSVLDFILGVMGIMLFTKGICMTVEVANDNSLSANWKAMVFIAFGLYCVYLIVKRFILNRNQPE